MTNKKRLVAIVMLMLVTCLMVAWLSETAHAGSKARRNKAKEGAGRVTTEDGGAVTTKEANKKGETSMLEKKGIEGLFAGKSLDADRAPTRLQKFMGIGSIFVMFAAVKYL